MKSKSIFHISCIIHVVALTLLIVLEDSVDVFGVFGFIFIPLLVSLVVCFWGQQIEKKKGPTHVKNRGLVYSIPNIVYLVFSSYLISKNIDAIFALSQKYQSEQLNVSVSNSPWFGFFILLVMAIVLHYAIANIGLKKNKAA